MIGKLKHHKLNMLKVNRFNSFVRPEAPISKVYQWYTNTPVKHPDKITLVPCCFHSERTPSLALYPTSNTFHCFGCQKHGDSISFIMYMDNCTYKEATQIIKSI